MYIYIYIKLIIETHETAIPFTVTIEEASDRIF